MYMATFIADILLVLSVVVLSVIGLIYAIQLKNIKLLFAFLLVSALNINIIVMAFFYQYPFVEKFFLR